MDKDPSKAGENQAQKGSDKQRNPETQKPAVRVTSNGTPYVRPIDIYNSQAGQAEIVKNLRLSEEG